MKEKTKEPWFCVKFICHKGVRSIPFKTWSSEHLLIAFEVKGGIVEWLNMDRPCGVNPRRRTTKDHHCSLSWFLCGFMKVKTK